MDWFDGLVTSSIFALFIDPDCYIVVVEVDPCDLVARDHPSPLQCGSRYIPLLAFHKHIQCMNISSKLSSACLRGTVLG